ncbi:MAG: hypothetical protein K9H49_15340 [Bacteroidales bacterium]|nr:hypothetical protein [Bacteroidales bacterium]MCF8391932.1 hypothetical protein [Bacteroidales bacterium]
MSPTDQLLDQHYKIQEHSETMVMEDKLLKKNKISRKQWDSFVEMVHNLELNRDGAKILLEEVRSGKVILPCER